MLGEQFVTGRQTEQVREPDRVKPRREIAAHALEARRVLYGRLHALLIVSCLQSLTGTADRREGLCWPGVTPTIAILAPSSRWSNGA